MTKFRKGYWGLILSVTAASFVLSGCSSDETSERVVQTTKNFTVGCSDLNLELTTTLLWRSSCEGTGAQLKPGDELPEVQVQLLSRQARDPLLTVAAMLKSRPGVYDVDLRLTNIAICGAFMCLSYEATFRRLSKSIERFGVIVVDKDEDASWEFTTSYETTPEHQLNQRPLALHVLDDLTYHLRRVQS